jgi:Fe-S-cluster containining protein
MKTQDVFDCQVCGVCCQGQGGIFITRDEAPGPAKLLGLTTEEFIRLYTEPRHGLLSLKIDDDGYCLLHDKQHHTCRIHAAKPPMCRDWPFFWGMLNNEEAFLAAKNNCPGIRPNVTWEEFKAWHKKHIKTMPPKSYIWERNNQ